MRSVRYHVAVAFGVDRDGALTPVVEEAAATPQDAVFIARRLGNTYAGAIAFSRTMDLGQGRYGLAKVHAVEGLIPDDLAPMCGRRSPLHSHAGRADCSSKMREPQDLSDSATVLVRPASWQR